MQCSEKQYVFGTNWASLLVQENELLEHVGDKANQAINWRLTNIEMKKALALRTEFAREKIARLKL